MLELTDDNFAQEVTESKGLVLVDLYATWCGPCRALAPTIKQIAEEYEGKVKVCKLDIEEAPEATENLEVMNVPTVVMFRDGQEIGRETGVMPKQKYLEVLGL